MHSLKKYCQLMYICKHFIKDINSMSRLINNLN